MRCADLAPARSAQFAKPRFGAGVQNTSPGSVGHRIIDLNQQDNKESDGYCHGFHTYLACARWWH